MTGSRTSRALAALSVVACVGCCALPTLLAAGLVVGGGWSALSHWLPGIAITALALALLAGWWAQHRRGCRCGAACSC